MRLDWCLVVQCWSWKRFQLGVHFFNVRYLSKPLCTEGTVFMDCGVLNSSFLLFYCLLQWSYDLILVTGLLKLKARDTFPLMFFLTYIHATMFFFNHSNHKYFLGSKITRILSNSLKFFSMFNVIWIFSFFHGKKLLLLRIE